MVPRTWSCVLILQDVHDELMGLSSPTLIILHFHCLQQEEEISNIGGKILMLQLIIISKQGRNQEFLLVGQLLILKAIS